MTQIEALNILKLGHTTFLTGEAGSGKSYTLNSYTKYLKSHDINYAVTASTGIAATHIGGSTIHSFSGIGAKESISKMDADILTEKEHLYKRWNSLNVLIIDEVSMLSAQFIDGIDLIAKAMRRSDKPFGGVQVVFCGDFFQLPPVGRYDYEYTFAYQSRSWIAARPVVCYLSEQHRQEAGSMLEILTAIRSQSIDEYHHEEILKRKVKHNSTEGQIITRLYTHNADVDAINTLELAKLTTELRTYYMESSGSKAHIESLKSTVLAGEEITLKIGAKVIAVKNDMNKRYYNGSVGTVVKFDDIDDMPIVEFELKNGNIKEVKMDKEEWQLKIDDKVKASVKQIPLRLGWAITIHKSQGMTLTEAEIDLSRTFTSGMGYVALSRLTTLEGLYLIDIGPEAYRIDENIINEDSRMKERSEYAAIALDKYNTEELATLHNNFIIKCGGSVAEVEAKDEEVEGVDKKSTFDTTLEYINQNLSIEEIANARGLTTGTIIDHIEKLYNAKLISVEYLEQVAPPKSIIKKINSTFKKLKTVKSKEVIEFLKEKENVSVSYNDIKLARLLG